MDLKTEALRAHEPMEGQNEVISRAPLRDAHDLTLAYTPGVAEPRAGKLPERKNWFTNIPARATWWRL